MTALAPSLQLPIEPSVESELPVSGPLRLAMEAPVVATVPDALATVLRIENVGAYLPSIWRAELKLREDGSPATRVCEVSGMGRLSEDIVWHDPTRGYAYSVRPVAALPMVDHLAVVTVRPVGGGGSVIRWEQRFNWRGFLKPLVMRLMFPRMMRTLGEGLQRDLGAAAAVSVAWQ